MSTSVLLIVLAAAIAHATWNVVSHGLGSIGLPFLWWGAVFSTVLCAGVVPLTGGLGADLGSLALGVGVSGVLHLGYMLVLQRGYRAGNLSTVYATARGSGPLISVVVAITLLGERPHPVALVGVAVVITGIIALGLVDRGHRAAVDRFTPRRRISLGIVFGLLTGVAIATYTIWDAHAVRTWHLAPVAYMAGCTLVEVALVSTALRHRRGELLPVLHAHWPRLVAFGVLSPLSYVLVLVAVQSAPVALVAPMREVSVVLVSLFGALVLHEGRAPGRIAASVVVVGGIALLAL
jgi:drug/metabolite transporter (DMT)-like permease